MQIAIILEISLRSYVNIRSVLDVCLKFTIGMSAIS